MCGFVRFFGYRTDNQKIANLKMALKKLYFCRKCSSSALSQFRCVDSNVAIHNENRSRSRFNDILVMHVNQLKSLIPCAAFLSA